MDSKYYHCGLCDHSWLKEEEPNDRHQVKHRSMTFIFCGRWCKEEFIKEKGLNAPHFTKEQVDWICYQIGEWYLDMKPLLEGQHNLGHMKERLKLMICPIRDESECV